MLRNIQTLKLIMKERVTMLRFEQREIIFCYDNLGG